MEKGNELLADVVLRNFGSFRMETKPVIPPPSTHFMATLCAYATKYNCNSSKVKSKFFLIKNIFKVKKARIIKWFSKRT
jgi:hypothetical protein